MELPLVLDPGEQNVQDCDSLSGEECKSYDHLDSLEKQFGFADSEGR